MTRAERELAAQRFSALMKRVRGASASASKQAIRQVDAALAQASASFGRVAAGTGALSQREADKLLGNLDRALARVEVTYKAAAQGAQRNVLSAIVNEHRTVNLSVAKVLRIGDGGVAVGLSTVPTSTKKLMQVLRKGQTLDAVVAGHVASASDAITSYIKNATGTMPSEQAVRGIRRLLDGQLPVDLGGMAKTDVQAGASLGWKSERLIVTESFEGYRQGNAKALTHAVVRTVAHWEIQKGACEVCVAIAEKDVGYGPGWYPPEQWPANPHPNCRCGQGKIRVIDPQDAPLPAADPNVKYPGQYAKRKARELARKQALGGAPSAVLKAPAWVGSMPSQSTVTAEQAASVIDYTGGSYENINEVLRTGKSAAWAGEGHFRVVDRALADAKNIDAVIAQAPVTIADSVVYRVADIKAMLGASGQAGQAVSGMVLQDLGFTSTSISRSVAAGYAKVTPNGVLFEIKLPKGARGLSVGDFSMNAEDKEFLLPRGGRYTIGSKRWDAKEGMDVYTVEYQPGVTISAPVPVPVPVPGPTSITASRNAAEARRVAAAQAAGVTTLPKAEVKIRVVKTGHTGTTLPQAEAQAVAVRNDLESFPQMLQDKLAAKKVKVEISVKPFTSKDKGTSQLAHYLGQKKTIWYGTGKGARRSTITHEFGHAVDFTVLGKGKTAWSTTYGRKVFSQMAAEMKTAEDYAGKWGISVPDAITRMMDVSATASARLNYYKYLLRCSYTNWGGSFEKELTADMFVALMGDGRKVRHIWSAEQFIATFPEVARGMRAALLKRGIVL